MVRSRSLGAPDEAVPARRGRIRLAAGIAVLALVAAACGGAGSAEGDGEEASAEGGPVELTVWIGRETTVPPDQFESFREEYPDITINYDIVDWGTAFETMVRMEGAGEPLPDVVQVDGFFLPGLAAAGLATDIGEYVTRWEEEDPESYEMLADVVWEDGMYDGVQLGMADIASMDQMFYRPDTFEELGLEIPTSNDELLELMRTVKGESELLPYSMFAGRGDGANFLITHMNAVGVEFEGSIPQLESEAGEYIIDFYQTVVREELTSPDVLAWGSDEARGAFIGSNAAMLVESIGIAEEMREIEDMACDEQWALFDLPTSRSGGGEDGRIAATAKNWIITTGSEHPYEASLVLRYLMDYENALGIALVGEIPRHTGVFESEEFQEQFPCFLPHLDTFLNTEPFSSDTSFFAVQNSLELMLQDLVANPDEPTAEFAARWQAELDALAP